MMKETSRVATQRTVRHSRHDIPVRCVATRLPPSPTSSHHVNITYACPACDEGVRVNFDAETKELCCPYCDGKFSIPPDAIVGDQVCRCIVCPSDDLFLRKDFPQRVGVALVGIGIIGSSIAWYYTNLPWTFGILFATALIDLLLYSLVGDALMCYRCHSQYRSVAELETHGHFDLEIHEKYRQLEARLEQQ